MKDKSITQGSPNVDPQGAWADFLREFSEGSLGSPTHIPSDLCSDAHSKADLISQVFGDLANDPSARSMAVLLQRRILTPKKKVVNAVNAAAVDMFPGDVHNMWSADYIEDPQAAATYPPELMNALQPQGMPPHELRLKAGIPVIMLLNLNPSGGLANGTQLMLTSIGSHVLRAEIATGTHIGKKVFIPRTDMRSTDAQLPFTFVRRQYPIMPAFAMTISKTQGQTFRKVGIYFPEPCCSPGQLHVAVSRGNERNAVKVMVGREHSKDGQCED